MLEHQKKILRGVSQNPDLFKKELIKSFKWLSSNEQILLRRWLFDNFYHLYPETIEKVIDEFAEQVKELH